jgi:hypothetical protein
MFGINKRMRKLESECRQLEFVVRDRLWMLENLPKFKKGDIVNVNIYGVHYVEKRENVEVLGEKEVVNCDLTGDYTLPIRTYYLLDGETVLERNERYLSLAKKES